MISVCIPVGPYEANKRWLDETIDSVLAQTMLPTQIVIIDDGANIDKWTLPTNSEFYTTIYKMPWRTGISHGFNYGVAYSHTSCVFMLGSDDTLEPTCLEKCWEAYNKRDKADGYYSVPVRYMDTGEIQTLPCNAAMVTKGFWRKTGGFPIESAVGAGDAALLSICMAHDLKHKDDPWTFWVGHDVGQDEVPLYNYRRHPDIHTYKLGPWWTVVNQTRDILTATFSEEEIQKWAGNY